MRCFNCGQHVPFWGEACPCCGTDKSMVQSVRIISVLCLIAGCWVGFRFWSMEGFFIGGIIGTGMCLAIDKVAFRKWA